MMTREEWKEVDEQIANSPDLSSEMLAAGAIANLAQSAKAAPPGSDTRSPPIPASYQKVYDNT